MEPLKTYDYLTLARHRVFDWVRSVGDEGYTRELPVGLKTLGRTLAHMLISEWYYVQRIEGNAVPPYEEWPIRDEDPPPFAKLEATWTEQAARTRAALASVRDWKTDLEYRVTDEGKSFLVSASRSDIFTQLVLHEVHHRAQAMTMLRQLGVSLGDIDYNTMMYKRSDISPE